MIRVLAKKGPCGTPHGQKKKVSLLSFLENMSKGDIKKGSAKGTEKKWSWMVSLYRPWQGPIGQGHGEWNGNRERLHGMAMGCPGRAKIAENKSKTSKI